MAPNVFTDESKTTFNLISDSIDVNTLRILEVAGPIKSSSPMCLLFQQLQHLIWQRRNCFYIQHMKVHTALPGPLNEGNNIIDQWTKMKYIYSYI